ncbi:MAG: hypothetical protein L3J75_11625 [Methylococcaceae bacterium]|nr:hypothetical protein [Methylococcaceae bacterium]
MKLIDFKNEAQALRDILQKYKEPDADLCLQAPDPIIQQVLNGKITQPISIGDIPCGYYFTQGTLRPVPGMISAFSAFANHIEGMHTDESKKFFANLDKKYAP